MTIGLAGMERPVATPARVYEKLQVFYLGRRYDLESGETTQDPVLYDSQDLVTHAVVVGMTGSGKTGLGVVLLEEAAIDGIPALVVDLKGDLANLALTFPELRPDDFQPWIHADDARRQGIEARELAARQASLWRQGLADWDQDGRRIRRLRQSADVCVYTPGSRAGVPISILSSFAAPPTSISPDGDLWHDRTSTTVTSLLSLLGIDADPLRSREHILLTSILDHCWRQRQDLDLGAMIRLVQQPPIERIGVMDVESVFPAKDRFELAMTMNNLLAAPGFATWLSGEPLEVDRLLYTPSGKPRLAILSIAHLSPPERMFFVSLLLNETLAWMRTRPGTTSLRALLYIDEIFGYLPPVAAPASKKPLLTLLKQGRAFGLGLILATQNPVDLDYKGLSNAGTWFIGRLQTQRDKDRLLAGLQGVTQESGESFDQKTAAATLSSLGKRCFLMHNVHESGPVVFHTRWALSYLAGPLTRQQIQRLAPPPQDSTGDEPVQPSATAGPQVASSDRPVLDSKITQVFLPARQAGEQVVFQPHVLALVRVHYIDRRRALSAEESLALLLPIEQDLAGADWDQARELDLDAEDLSREPPPGARFAPLSGDATQPRTYAQWGKSLASHIYRTRRFELFQNQALREYSRPGESERDFRIRLGQEAREARDRALEKLRQKYASKLRTVEDRVERARQTLDRERQQAEGASMQAAIAWGTTVLSAVLGRKRLSRTTVGRAASAARSAQRSRAQASDVHRAEQTLLRYQQQLEDLELEIQQEEDLVAERYDPLLAPLKTIQLKPRKSDIDVRLLALGWTPFIPSQSQADA